MLSYAIIPARSGSKGVPDKNIRLVGGHPLLAWSIAAAKRCLGITRVIVSTDSEKYANIARQYGAETPFLRPPEFSTDTSHDSAFLVHATRWFLQHETHAPDCWVHLRPTSPLRDPTIIEDAIQLFRSTPQATSLRSAHEAAESPAKWFAMQGEYFTGFMGNEYLEKPRQQCPVAYNPNGYVDIVRSQQIISAENMYFPNMLAFTTAEIIEVDTLGDFEKLEFFVHKGHFLLQELNKYTSVEV